MSVTFEKVSQTVMRAVRSPRFFYIIILVLVVQASWIALTARYPQAFDENFHFGLIQLHAQQWLPFFRTQPPNASVYGALAHDPSYLYHFLLSLPYRLLVRVTMNQMAQIIVLRFINIMMFVTGLYVYRRLFDEMHIGRGMRNISLFFFVLLPVVPLLAGQINYDNLMLPLTGLIFIYVARYIQYMRGRKVTEPLIPFVTALQIILVGGLGSLVKFAYAPIFLAAGAVLVTATIFYYYIARIKPAIFGSVWAANRKLVLIGLAVCTLVVLVLCTERYGVNLVQYHSPVPKCDKILTIDECQLYSPWARDYLFSKTLAHPSLQGYAVYPFVWFNRMLLESLFTITSYLYVPWNTVTYIAYSPLMIAWVTAWSAFGIGLIGALRFWRRIRRNRPLTVTLLISAFYTFVLFFQNFSMYRYSGEAVAIHGRYLIPVYPILLVCLTIGWKGMLETIRLTRYQGVLLVAVTLLFLQGGGITNWLRRSDAAWYWQQTPAAQQANNAVKAVIDRTTFEQ